MQRKVTFKGNAVTLVGRVIKTGMPAPDFKLLTSDLKEVSLSDFKDKIKVISIFISIDTPVCDSQVKEFNKRAAVFSPEVIILGVSKDLPFAQTRFCQANEIKSLVTLSDYKFSSFGINYGLLIKEMNLLARAVIILDKKDTIRYIQIVPELTSAPDYEDALNNLKEIIKNPELSLKQELPERCKPCEGGTLPLPKEKIEKLLAKYHGWELIEDKKLAKEFKFKDFVEAKYFFDLVSEISEEQGHHPNLFIAYNKLKITLTTHTAGGLTDNDFIMAKIIDELGAGE